MTATLIGSGTVTGADPKRRDFPPYEHDFDFEPVTFYETQGWACLGYPDPDVFFPTTEADLLTATTMCAACPSRQACLDRGVAGRATGVWGGVLLLVGQVSDELLKVERGPMKPRARKNRTSRGTCRAA